MGVVYQATDTKLGRSVAIKLLPAAFASDAERLSRFRREAQVLAALNHPNIAHIYGLEESGETRCIVMELVEGETLQARIQRGRIPVEECLAMAKQIAEALEAAHEKGVVHRDLKPGNVMLTSEAMVKVLDFGLAKAYDTNPSSATSSNSPTMAGMAATNAGVILGTAAYMAPEQARGKAVDKRADIWAFGVVFWEMLTGKRLFIGKTVSDVMAAVLTKDPDWTTLPAETPAPIRRLLRRCLEKDRKRRMADARLEIEEALTAPSTPGGSAGSATSSTLRGRLVWMVAFGVAVLGMAAMTVPTVRYLRQTPIPAPLEKRPLRVSILHTEGSEVGAPAISPDGRRVAYRARRGDGMPLLWVRDLAGGDAQPLPGTEDATLPFWSPDSRALGFFTGVALKRVPAAGGPVRIVVDYIGPFGGFGGAWAADGSIAFGGGPGLSRVSADGGAATGLTNPQSDDWAHFWPSFLPDGRRFLFTAKQYTRAAEASEQGIYLGSLDSPEIRKLLPDLSSAVYAPPGYLVFVREGTLTAALFDLAAGCVTGAPAPIGGAVATDAACYFAAVSASADGTLAVRPPPAVALVSSGQNTPNVELHRVDRSGTGSRVGTARLFTYFMALNPVDSRNLAVAIQDPRAGTQDLTLMDLSNDSTVPLTTTRGFTANPVWSADGKRLAYTYQPPGQLDDVYVKDIRTGLIQRVIETPTILEHPVAWSHDQQSLLVFTYDDTGTYLSSWSFGSRTLTRFVGPRAVEGAAFSPQDDLVVFTSQETGRPEVYVTTFPDHRQTWPVTTEGGRVLSWRNDGREILVATLSGHVVTYPVSTDGGFSHGQPATLVRDVGIMADYSAATREHSRILIRVSPDAAKDKGEMRLLFGWQDALRQSKQ